MMETPAETRRVEYGSTTIEFTIRRAGCSRLTITVRPRGAVDVRVPFEATDEEIDRRVIRRGRWIGKQLRELADLRMLQPDWEFVSGETHRYLGRQYRLRIHEGAVESVKLHGQHFDVAVADPGEPASVERALDAWYRHHATRRWSPHRAVPSHRALLPARPPPHDCRHRARAPRPHT